MKKIALLLAGPVLAASAISATQDVFIIERTNGEKLELDVSTIKEMRFKTESEGTGNLAPEGVEIIDLGLSVCWASCNVGATSPEQTGGFVQWGVTAPQDWYSWSYYPFGSAQNLKKYTGNDGLTVLQPEDDYASQTWGTDWRMPTRDECLELLDNCDVDFDATENGVPGVRLTSRVEGYEGKSVFFPATGYIQDGHIVSPENVYVWTSSVGVGLYQFALSMHLFREGDYALKTMVPGHHRYLGENVRAVIARPEKKGPETVDLGLSVDWGICNVGASAPEETGMYVAWGETAEKDSYSWATYSLGSGSTSIDKYSRTDKVATLEPCDDVATAVMGGDWRMPTSEEVKELFANCDVDAATVVNGVNCITFTSRVKGYEGAQIVIPMGGYRSEAGLVGDNSSIALWTSDVVAMGFRDSAYGYEGSPFKSPQVKSANRFIGRNVRGVRGK